MLLIRVTLPPFDRYKRFQPANFLSIFSRIGFHLVLSLKLAPKGRPRYFIGREPSLQPRTFSNKSILSTTTCSRNQVIGLGAKNPTQFTLIICITFVHICYSLFTFWYISFKMLVGIQDTYVSQQWHCSFYFVQVDNFLIFHTYFGITSNKLDSSNSNK